MMRIGYFNISQRSDYELNAKTPAQRKAAQRLRDRERGLVEILVKVRIDRVDEMREIEVKLQKKKRSNKA